MQVAWASMRRTAAADPTSLLSHVGVGALIGGAIWGIATWMDRDASDAIDTSVRPVAFGMAPEITNIFLNIQDHMQRHVPEHRELFEEAVREVDALLILEMDIDKRVVLASTEAISTASGCVRRALTALRKFRDAGSQARAHIVNQHMSHLTSLIQGHVGNIRSASMCSY